MVGSVFAFCEDVHGVEPIMLDTNYRSSSMLVGFSLEAGYRRTLKSFSPELRLNLLDPLPQERPDGWPEELYWTPEWASLLDPNLPALCFVYPEGRSSQWNRFEADAVAAIIALLRGRAAGLSGERDPATGDMLPRQDKPYSPPEFWKKAVGVVTPHRAQQGLIAGRLQRTFPDEDPNLIREAVDTVERFQDQERDLIIASYALGDPDAIADEDEFLMSANRFNVMASRPRAKLIVFVSREVSTTSPKTRTSCADRGCSRSSSTPSAARSAPLSWLHRERRSKGGSGNAAVARVAPMKNMPSFAIRSPGAPRIHDSRATLIPCSKEVAWRT